MTVGVRLTICCEFDTETWCKVEWCWFPYLGQRFENGQFWARWRPRQLKHRRLVWTNCRLFCIVFCWYLGNQICDYPCKVSTCTLAYWWSYTGRVGTRKLSSRLKGKSWLRLFKCLERQQSRHEELAKLLPSWRLFRGDVPMPWQIRNRIFGRRWTRDCHPNTGSGFQGFECAIDLPDWNIKVLPSQTRIPGSSFSERRVIGARSWPEVFCFRKRRWVSPMHLSEVMVVFLRRCEAEPTRLVFRYWSFSTGEIF